MKTSSGCVPNEEAPWLPFDTWPSKPLPLPAVGTWPESQHLFDMESVWAIRTALATGRPLLLRGKPGMGKSQLARAAAVKLGVPFLSVVVDERTERDDLLLSYDAVARLAQAQVVGALAKDGEDWKKGLEEQCFIRPGPLWWAFDWKGASDQALLSTEQGRTCLVPEVPKGWTPASQCLCGPVILVDEIDKADASVPNGLLETLANDGFEVQQPSKSVMRPAGVPPPLVVITTNEERELPAAFLRRCLVHRMVFPAEGAQAEAFLIGRARVHFRSDEVSDAVCKEVAEQLWKDREKARKAGGHEPGPAEYLDVIRALADMGKAEEAHQRETFQRKAFQRVRAFAFEKHLA